MKRSSISPLLATRASRWGFIRTAISACLLVLVLVLPSAPAGFAQDAPAPDASPSAPPVAVPAFRQANDVVVLTVHGEIDHLTLRSLERRIAEAVEAGADAIVLEIDTPGGRMDATLDICNLLKDHDATLPNVVAWIRPQAYSAGTIIALACREIVVAPNATFGDAAPIQAVAGALVEMADTERAKVEAPILAEVVDSARRNHYDENLVQSFVSVGIELWLIVHKDTGEHAVVDRQEFEAVFGEEPPQQLTPVAPPAGVAPRGVAPRYRAPLDTPDPAAEQALTAEEIRAQIEFQQQLPASRAPLTEADRGQWAPVLQIISSDRLLTVKAAESRLYGLSAATIQNDSQLKSFFGAQTLTRLDRTWSESLVRILVSLPVRIVLIIIFLVSLFIELAAPGMGVFGATAAVALGMLIGAPYLAGMAQWWDILLIVLGLILLAMEILVIPGLGVAGIGGALCLLVGLVGTFITGDIRSATGQEELGRGVISILTALFAAGIGIWLVSRHVHSMPVINRLMLKAELHNPGEGPSSGTGVLEAMGAARSGLETGAVGTAETDLRPSGRGDFEGRLVDVQSPGRYIEKGSRIRVIAIDRYVIEVEEVES